MSKQISGPRCLVCGAFTTYTRVETHGMCMKCEGEHKRMATYVKCKACEVLIYTDSMGTIRNRKNGLRHACKFIPPTTTTKEITMESGKLFATIVRKGTPKKSTQDMIIGQIAEVQNFDKKILLLRAYNSFVNLLDPSETFGNSFNREADILPSGSTVTLTVASGLTATVEGKILDFLKVGNLIMAIKEVRTATGLGLVEAKKYAEEFRQKSWDNGDLPKTYATQFPGATKPYNYDSWYEETLPSWTSKSDVPF